LLHFFFGKQGKKSNNQSNNKEKNKRYSIRGKIESNYEKNGYNWQKKITNPRTKLEKAKKWEDCENMQIRTALKEIMRKCPIGQENKK